jgi:hypothetical protein
MCILHPEWRVCLHIAEVSFPAGAVPFIRRRLKPGLKDGAGSVFAEPNAAAL